MTFKIPFAALAVVAGALIFETSHAQVRVTEVMSSSASSTPDWFEVTNYGAVTVTLDSDWRMDDSSASFGSSVAFGSTINVAPGETVVFLETSTGSVRDSFITLWGLPDLTQVTRRPSL